MVVKGKTLILDNFRKVLSGYSVDIQDVVRSAILDGVDIAKYIDVCKDNPYRLEQIRLSIKEGLDSSLFGLNGDTIYRVRKLAKSGNIDTIISQISKGSLSEEHIGYLLDWVQGGRSLDGVELAIIPKNLLSVYDVGLSYGVDMSCFNGINYDAEYLTDLIRILNNKRPIDKFLNPTEWDKSVVRTVSMHSNNHLGWYEKWVDCLTPDMSYDKVDDIRTLYTYMIRLNSKFWLSNDELKSIDDSGLFEVLIKAAKDGMNLRNFLNLDKFSAESLYMSNKQGTRSKISGNIRGRRD